MREQGLRVRRGCVPHSFSNHQHLSESVAISGSGSDGGSEIASRPRPTIRPETVSGAGLGLRLHERSNRD
jgi:hypothetical protein